MKLPDAFQVALQVEPKSVSVRDDAGPGDFQTGGQFGDLLLHLLAFREAFGDGDPTDHAVPGSNHPTVSTFPGKVSANEPIARREYELIAEHVAHCIIVDQPIRVIVILPVAKDQSLDLRLGQVPEKPLNVRVWESLVVLGQSFDEPTPRRQLVLLPWLVVVRVEEIVGRVAGDEEFGSQLVDVILPSTDRSLEVGLRLADKLATLFDPSPSHLHGTEPLIHGVTGVILGIDEVDAAFVVQLEEVVLAIKVVVVLRDAPVGKYLVDGGDCVPDQVGSRLTRNKIKCLRVGEGIAGYQGTPEVGFASTFRAGIQNVSDRVIKP